MTINTKRWLGLLTLFCITSLANTVTAQIPLISILATDPHAAEEGADPGSFTLLRTGNIGQELTVFYNVGGTAENGTDYTPLTGSVTFPPNCSCVPINCHPIDDALVEGNEIVVVALVQPTSWPPPYFVTWPSAAFLTIEDNDSPPVNEPPRVALVSPPDESVFLAPVDLTLTARASDSDGRVVSVEFFDGETSLGIVRSHPLIATPLPDEPFLRLDTDRLPELLPDASLDLLTHPAHDLLSASPGSLFRLRWENVPPGGHRLTAVATDNRGAATTSSPVHIRVTDPPVQPVVNVRASDPVGAEPGPLGHRLDPAIFTVHRSGSVDFPMDVFYRLGGSAENGVDYRELPSTVTIPRGSRSADIVVAPFDDNLVEGTEHVRIQIVPPVCIAIFPPPQDCYRVGRHDAARAAILDNDAEPNLPPVARIVSPADGEVFRAPTDITLAALAQEFDGQVHTVEFFAGDRSLGIVTNDPAVVRPDRPPFVLTWENVPPGHYILTAEATDNDGATGISRPVEIKVVEIQIPPVVTIEATDDSASEGPLFAASGQPGEILPRTDNALFTVSRTGPTDRPLIVRYALDGSARNGADYQLLSGQVIIPEGSATAPIVIIPIDDAICEGTERVVASLLPSFCTSSLPAAPNCYIVGSPGRAGALIHDNDVCPPNLPPRVAILHPADGDLFRAPASIRIVAGAEDPDGRVVQVAFFANGTHIGNAPAGNTIEEVFHLKWPDVPAGGYVLTAVATDNDGASSTSEPVRIRVIEHPILPVVTIEATDPRATEGLIHIGPPEGRDPILVATENALLTEIGEVELRGPDILDVAVFTVKRSGPTNAALTVFYELDGTAGNGGDYDRLSGEVTIPAGAASARIVVVPIDDTLPEPTETVIAKLVPVNCISSDPGPAGCYVIGNPGRAEAFIRDNDPAPNQLPRIEIVSPEDGSLFSAPADIGVAAIARDPDGWVSLVEFFEGSTKIGESSIHFLVPPPPNQQQRFHILWSTVPTGGYDLTAKATDNRGGMSVSEPVSIKVIDPADIPVVTVRSPDAFATEPDLNGGELDTARFQVHRSSRLSFPLTVRYSLRGAAENGIDYEMLSGEVTIPPNAHSADVVIRPLHDLLVEGTEQVAIRLLDSGCGPVDPPPVDCYIVGPQYSSIAYIRDNDREPNLPPRVTLISPEDGAVFQSPLDLRIVASAADSDGWVATVEFFADGASLGIITNRPFHAQPIPIDHASTTAADWIQLNPFHLAWTGVPPGDHVLTAVATDNDGARTESEPVGITVEEPPARPIVEIKATDPAASEGDPSPGTVNAPDTATFTIARRGGDISQPLDVFFRIGGSASNGEDYREIPHNATIPAGAHRTEVIINPIDDNLVEGPEDVVLSLVPPVCIAIDPPPHDCYAVGRNRTAEAIIRDNDRPNHPPTTSLLRPSDGETFMADSDIVIVAEAGDIDGSVRYVEFFEGDNSLGIVTNPIIRLIPLPIDPSPIDPIQLDAHIDPLSDPRLLDLAIDPIIRPPSPLYVLTWEQVPAGRYTLRAVAVDNDGDRGISRPVEIKVTPREPHPIVNIHATDSSASEIDPRLDIVEDPALFTITRTGSTEHPLTVHYRVAGTADNGIDYREIASRVIIPSGASSAEVVIHVIDDTLCEGTESVVLWLTDGPCITDFPPPRRCYRVGAASAARAGIIDDDICPPNQPPLVEIVQPEDNSVFRAPAQIAIWAKARDRDGRVVSVEFFEGDNSLGLVTSPASDPDHLFVLRWPDVPPGSYALTAVATDNDGASTRSGIIHIRVLPRADQQVVHITASDPSATEGGIPVGPPGSLDPNTDPAAPVLHDPAVFTVTRSGDTTDALTVFYGLGGTAENGVDYARLSGEVTIPAGEQSARIVVDPIDDTLVEGAETVVARLRPPVCIAIFPPPPGCYLVGHQDTATAFIRDNDLAANLPPRVEIVNPVSGESFHAPARIEIAAHTSDPDGWVTQIQFLEGNNPIGGIAILVSEPPPPGELQRFHFTWEDVRPGQYVLTARVTDNGGATTTSEPVRIEVVDPNVIPVVTITAEDPWASEGPGRLEPADPRAPTRLEAALGGTELLNLNTATFVVRRSGRLSHPLIVNYSVGGTAENGEDYRELTGQVMIPAWQDSAMVVVVPFDDDLVEGAESVVLELVPTDCLALDPAGISCYRVGHPGRATAFIRDNDFAPNEPPFVSIVRPADGSLFEAPADIEVVVHALDPDGWVSSVALFEGNELIGEQSIVFIVAPEPGQLQTFEFDWNGVPPGRYVLTAKATDQLGAMAFSRRIEITVGDPAQPPVVTLMAPDAYATEQGNDGASFRVRRNGPTTSPLTVHYEITGTALNGIDYLAIPTSITIPAGRRTARINITPLPDNLVEEIETVILQLALPGTAPAPYIIGTPDAAAAIIVDNGEPHPRCLRIADGSFHLCLPIPDGISLRIEASQNLRDWQWLGNNTVTGGALHFVDPNAPKHTMRYYRVVQDVDLEMMEEEAER